MSISNFFLRLSFFLSILIVSETIYAQTFIEGKIIDMKSNKAVAYANLSITNSNQGTASDENGNFFLKIESNLIAEKIKISCIGYSNMSLAIDSLSGISEKEVLIKLKPSDQLLNEVVINEKKIDPEELLKQAILAIPKNYIQEPFNMEFYSRITLKEKDSFKTVYQIESIIQTYRKGYIQKAMNISKILQMRETGIDPLPSWRHKKTKIDYSAYAPGFDIFLSDLIGHGHGYSVFSPATFKKMKFRYAGVSIFDKDTVCAIEYAARKSNIKGDSTELDGKYNGIIYVAVNNLAIVRHKLKIGSGKYDIIYKKQEGFYFPYFIRSEGRQPVLLKGFASIHEVFLKNINTDGVQPLENKMEYWDPKDVPYRKEYWQANYPEKKSFKP